MERGSPELIMEPDYDFPCRYPYYGDSPDDSHPAFDTIEFVAVMIFTVEYGLKFLTVWSQSISEIKGKETGDDDEDVDDLYEDLTSNDADSGATSSSRRRVKRTPWARIRRFLKKYRVFIFDIMNLIDLVAILPFYISLASGSNSDGLAVVRVLRVVRIFRVFKLGRYSDIMKMFVAVFSSSAALLANIMFFVFLVVILFGSLIYFTEGGEYNPELGIFERPDLTPGGKHESPYVSIFSGCYWLIQTASTVGFGDFFPTTIAGRIIAVVAMLISLAIIALPVTVIASNFSEYMKEYEITNKTKEQGTGKPDSRPNQLRRLNFLIRESYEVVKILESLRDEVEAQIQLQGMHTDASGKLLLPDSRPGTREPSANYLQAGQHFRSGRTESAPLYSAEEASRSGLDSASLGPPSLKKKQHSASSTGSDGSRVRFLRDRNGRHHDDQFPPPAIELAKIESHHEAEVRESKKYGSMPPPRLDSPKEEEEDNASESSEPDVFISVEETAAKAVAKNSKAKSDAPREHGVSVTSLPSSESGSSPTPDEL